MEKKLQEKASLLDRFLDTVERVCNKLPPPAILFGILFVITAIVGALCTQAGFEMYPLYWTPSKEGTFCVIRLNLS
nr:AbgT family transporter [Acidaminococcus intestini]